MAAVSFAFDALGTHYRGHMRVEPVSPPRRRQELRDSASPIGLTAAGCELTLLIELSSKPRSGKRRTAPAISLDQPPRVSAGQVNVSETIVKIVPGGTVPPAYAMTGGNAVR